MEPTLAKALGVRWSLELARNQQWHKIIISTDALVVADCIHRKYSMAILENVIDDCISILSEFDYTTVYFIGRNRNLEAHKLIDLALNIGSKTWFGDLEVKGTSAANFSCL